MTTQTGHTQAIAASRVIGTSVYNTEGTSIGSIEDVMLDKMTNGIMFAVIGLAASSALAKNITPFRGQASTMMRTRAAMSCRFPRNNSERRLPIRSTN